MVVPLRYGFSGVFSVLLDLAFVLVSWENRSRSLLLWYREDKPLYALRAFLIRTIFDIQSFYVGFAVSVMSLNCRRNPSDIASETAHSGAFLILSILFSIFGRRKDPRECALTGVGSCSTGEASTIICTKGGDGAAYCASVGRLIILRVHVRKLSCSSFSG